MASCTHSPLQHNLMIHIPQVEWQRPRISEAMPILLGKAIVFFQHLIVGSEGLCRLKLAVSKEVGISLPQPSSRRRHCIIPRIYDHLLDKIGSTHTYLLEGT